MQASHVSTPIANDISTIFVAIELSQRSWLVTVHCPDKDKMSRHKLEGGDHAGLLALIDRMRERAAGKLGMAPRAAAAPNAKNHTQALSRTLDSNALIVGWARCALPTLRKLSYELFSPDMIGPNRSHVSPLNRCICNCSIGAKSVGLVLIFVPGR